MWVHFNCVCVVFSKMWLGGLQPVIAVNHNNKESFADLQWQQRSDTEYSLKDKLTQAERVQQKLLDW